MSLDPGKYVQTRLTTKEWKAFAAAAKTRSVPISFAVRLAVLDWTSCEEAATQDLTRPADGADE